MIVLYATMELAPDSREIGVELLAELAEASRAEPGVIDYRVATDLEVENSVHVFEQYEDEAAVEAHMSSDHFLAFQEDVQPHLADAPTLHRFDVAEVSRVM